MSHDVRALLSSTPGLPPHPHAPRNAAGFGADTYNVDAMRDTCDALLELIRPHLTPPANQPREPNAS